MALQIERVNRMIYYYELNFDFKQGFQTEDGDQFRELFRIIIKLAKTKAAIRYQDFGERSLFIQDVKIDPLSKQVLGKLRCIRKNLLPEIMNTETDEARGIEAKAEEGLLETTHFVVDFNSKKKKLALEYNQFGAKIVDFISYLENIGRNKGALTSVGFVPIVRNELKSMKRRINRCSKFIVKVDKDYLTEIRRIDKGLYSMMEASI